MKLPSHVWQIKSGKESAKTVVIMGSIHGDEKVGACVIDQLRNEFEKIDLKMDVYLILGNPYAHQAGKRFVEFDMNRLFGEKYSELLQADLLILSKEERRAVELAEVLKKADLLVDIHSTIKPSVPFVYCEATSEHLELAKLLGTKYLVSAAAHFRPDDLNSSSDNFVDHHGGIGLTYESGWSQNSLKSSVVAERVKFLLQSFGVAEFGMNLSLEEDALQLLIYDHLIPKSKGFKFAADFSNFDYIEKGGLIAEDNERRIVAERDLFIIFPKKNIEVGSLACYLAYKN